MTTDRHGRRTHRQGGRYLAATSVAHLGIAALAFLLLPCFVIKSATVAADTTASKLAEITFDDLKFPMDKGDPFRRSLLTPPIEKLHGRVVHLRGYMLPSFQQKGITQFVLVRDNMECCFGPGAALYDCVLVDMKPGTTAAYTVRPVGVRGRFEISEFKGPDGTHLAIYRLVGEEVK